MEVLKNSKGVSIPAVGLGTFPLQGREMAEMVKKAIEIGYRLFDTADDYYGESGIGLALKELVSEHICDREDIFIQTKISSNSSHDDDPLLGFYFNKYSPFMKRHSVEDIVREKVENSLRELKTDYLDSLLIHLPYPGYFEDIWEAMVKIKDEGKIRYIGVSNFHKRHIEELEKSGILPAINEIYISPIGSKQDQVDYHKRKGILLMTYSPLMDLAYDRIPIESIRPLMDKYHKSAAQILLRWNIERECFPLPKTKNTVRLKENFNVFDFTMTEKETELISSLNYDFQLLPESRICPGL